MGTGSEPAPELESGPCVAVDREAGEQARQALAERDLVDDAREITVSEGRLYVPVTDPAGVPAAYDVVERELPVRESATMPADVLEFSPSYERLGDVVIVDEDDPRRARALADAVVESALPVTTVLNRASKVQGQRRIREWEVLASDSPDSPTETVHREYGCAFAVDLAEVYFSPRLATERHRVVEQVEPDERVFDMFAGVGPFVIPAAKQGATAVGVDVNPVAVEYLRDNAERNGVADRVTAIEGDVREVIGNGVGTGDGGTAEDEDRMAASTDGTRYAGWADRIVMNLPHSADDFLATAVALAGEHATLHYYDIQGEDDPYGPGERAIRAAAEPDYEVTVANRHTVRSYAPHELNVVLDVRLDSA